MTAIRVGRRKRFTTIDRKALNDSRLSFRARGVLAWLLDKPDDWTTTADSIASAGQEGREAVRTALGELETVGYLDRRKWREAGRWKSEWTVFECPPQRVSGAGEPTRLTSAGEPLRNPGPQVTEDGEQKTDLTDKPVSEGQKPDPDCYRCQGRGSYYRASGGFDAPCECTFANAESAP